MTTAAPPTEWPRGTGSRAPARGGSPGERSAAAGAWTHLLIYDCAAALEVGLLGATSRHPAGLTLGLGRIAAAACGLGASWCPLSPAALDLLGFVLLAFRRLLASCACASAATTGDVSAIRGTGVLLGVETVIPVCFSPRPMLYVLYLVLAAIGDGLMDCLFAAECDWGHGGGSGMWQVFSSVLPLVFCCAVVALCIQTHLNRLGRAAEKLGLERDALQTLTSMFCEGTLWLSRGQVVLRSDRRVELLTGLSMEGTKLNHHVVDDDVEQERVWNTFAGGVGYSFMAQKLVHTTLRQAAQTTLDVDLFIVDLRPPQVSKGSALEAYDEVGFLVGVRTHSSLRGCSGTSDSLEPLSHPSRIGGTPDEDTPLSDGEGASPCHLYSHSLAWHCAEPACTLGGGAGHSPSSEGMSRLPSQHGSLATLEVLRTSRESLFDALLDAFPTQQGVRDTAMSVLRIVSDPACGGALVVVAPMSALKQVFSGKQRGEGTFGFGRYARPSLCTCDGGYMTALLQGVHVSDPRFARAFYDFSQHTATDRWPDDHPDPLARGQPKDGAFLIRTSGYCVKGAVKILGLPPPRRWEGVGTKHEAALACAWAVEGSVVVVRSASGSTVVLFRRCDNMFAYQLNRDWSADLPAHKLEHP